LEVLYPLWGENPTQEVNDGGRRSKKNGHWTIPERQIPDFGL